MNILLEEEPSPIANFVFVKADEIFTDLFSNIKNDKKVIFVLETDNLHGVAEQRRFLLECVLHNTENPVIIKRDYKELDLETFKVWSSTDIGSLLIDGFGDGVWTYLDNPELSKEEKYPVLNSTLFGILQAARVRISKTEYIACPSCGRTLFDLVVVTNKIRKRTEHLKGVKIGIMGCIVNGPGEMADADYGYVGSGVGKITLYRGKDVVYKNIDSENAVDELIALIKEDGKWIDSQKST